MGLLLLRQDEGKTDIHTSFEGHQRVEVSVYIFENKVGFRIRVQIRSL